MTYLAKTVGGWCADAQAGAVRTHKGGENGFQFTIAGHQRIIIGIGDNWRIIAVIALIMKGDRFRQASQFGGWWPKFRN